MLYTTQAPSGLGTNLMGFFLFGEMKLDEDSEVFVKLRVQILERFVNEATPFTFSSDSGSNAFQDTSSRLRRTLWQNLS